MGLRRPRGRAGCLVVAGLDQSQEDQNRNDSDDNKRGRFRGACRQSGGALLVRVHAGGRESAEEGGGGVLTFRKIVSLMSQLAHDPGKRVFLPRERVWGIWVGFDPSVSDPGVGTAGLGSAVTGGFGSEIAVADTLLLDSSGPSDNHASRLSSPPFDPGPADPSPNRSSPDSAGKGRGRGAPRPVARSPGRTNERPPRPRFAIRFPTFFTRQPASIRPSIPRPRIF